MALRQRVPPSWCVLACAQRAGTFSRTMPRPFCSCAEPVPTCSTAGMICAGPPLRRRPDMWFADAGFCWRTPSTCRKRAPRCRQGRYRRLKPHDTKRCSSKTGKVEKFPAVFSDASMRACEMPSSFVSDYRSVIRLADVCFGRQGIRCCRQDCRERMRCPFLPSDGLTLIR